MPRGLGSAVLETSDMASYVLITRADGGLSVLALANGADAQQELDKWATQADPLWLPAVSARVAVDPVFPSKAQRSGWKDNGSAVVVDQARVNSLAAGALAALRTKAKELFQAMEQSARRDRAIALVTMDEVNALRDWVTQLKAAVAGASTYAAMKTAVAALPNMPQRTVVQAKNAVLARIDTAEAD